MASLTDRDVDDIAGAVVKKLGGAVMSSALPAFMGPMIREAAQHGQRMQWNMVYLSGPNAINTHWTINPDGTLHLELSAPNGNRVWRGIFRPVED